MVYTDIKNLCSYPPPGGDIREPFTIMLPQNEMLTNHVKEMFSFYLVRNECQKGISNFNTSAISVVDTECGQVDFTGHKPYPENEQTEVWEYWSGLVTRGLALWKFEKEEKIREEKNQNWVHQNKLKSSLYLGMYVNERPLDLAFIRLWTES